MAKNEYTPAFVAGLCERDWYSSKYFFESVVFLTLSTHCIRLKVGSSPEIMHFWSSFERPLILAHVDLNFWVQKYQSRGFKLNCWDFEISQDVFGSLLTDIFGCLN